jgi:hypothetical protein
VQERSKMSSLPLTKIEKIHLSSAILFVYQVCGWSQNVFLEVLYQGLQYFEYKRDQYVRNCSLRPILYFLDGPPLKLFGVLAPKENAMSAEDFAARYFASGFN